MAPLVSLHTVCGWVLKLQQQSWVVATETLQPPVSKIFTILPFKKKKALQVALVVKNTPSSAGDIRDPGSISGQEGPLEEGTATHSSILAGRTPWTKEPAGYSLWGHKEPDTNEAT